MDFDGKTEGEGLTRMSFGDKVRMKKKLVIISLAVLGFLILLPFVVLCFNPWSEILCRHEEINIQTAQVRYSRYVYFIKVTEQTEDTWLSHYVQVPTDHTAVASWRRVNTFSPLASNSPHYAFHGATGQIGELQMAFTTAPEAEKKQAAEGLLQRWQEGNDSFSAREYMDSIFEWAISNTGLP